MSSTREARWPKLHTPAPEREPPSADGQLQDQGSAMHSFHPGFSRQFRRGINLAVCVALGRELSIMRLTGLRADKVKNLFLRSAPARIDRIPSVRSPKRTLAPPMPDEPTEPRRWCARPKNSDSGWPRHGPRRSGRQTMTIDEPALCSDDVGRHTGCRCSDHPQWQARRRHT
jgi:hypothetical protein